MARLNGFTKKQIIDVYQKMALSRKLDDKMLILLKQGKSFFHIGASGHEGAQLAAAGMISLLQRWRLLYRVRHDSSGTVTIFFSQGCRSQFWWKTNATTLWAQRP